MKHLRPFSVLAVAAFLVGSPKVWAISRATQINVNSASLSILDNNSKQNTAKSNNPTLNIPSGNAQQNNDAVIADGFSGSGNQNGTVTIVALAGTLTLNMPDGSKIQLDSGTGAIIDPKTMKPVKDAKGNDVQTLSALLANSSPADQQALISGLTASVQTHAQQVVSATNAADAKTALTETAVMMKALAKSVPADTLSTIMTTAVTTIAKSTSIAGGASTNTAISALIEGAKQGGASVDSMVTAANTGVKAVNSSASFTATDVQTAKVITTAVVTTPLNTIDVSIVSKSN